MNGQSEISDFLLKLACLLKGDVASITESKKTQ